MSTSSPNIALTGRTGSGKSTAAQFLEKEFAYHRASPGKACREITQRLFGRQDKTRLNEVNDALRALDPNVWLRVAIEESLPGRPMVIDGMRFRSNYLLLRERGFLLVKIEASLATRIRRLEARGQVFDPSTDEEHAGENEIEDLEFDRVITNNSEDSGAMCEELRQILSGR